MIPLIDEWCRREKLEKLDILSLQESNLWTIDAVLPFKSDSLGLITCTDVLQYMDARQIVQFFNEAYRVLVPGGWLIAVVPSPNGLGADMNPAYKTRFNRNTFLHFSRRDFAATLPGVACRYDLVQTLEFYPEDGTEPDRHEAEPNRYRRFNMRMLRADMAAIKDGVRWPGPKLI
jgi:SAM-dependent methyltransferase